MIHFPDKKYNIIYADPCWSYRDKRDKHTRMCGGATSHYKTLEMEDIYKLQVKDIATRMNYLVLGFLSANRRTELYPFGFKCCHIHPSLHISSNLPFAFHFNIFIAALGSAKVTGTSPSLLSTIS